LDEWKDGWKEPILPIIHNPFSAGLFAPNFVNFTYTSFEKETPSHFSKRMIQKSVRVVRRNAISPYILMYHYFLETA